jgi:hypothetical protein
MGKRCPWRTKAIKIPELAAAIAEREVDVFREGLAVRYE